MPRIEVQFHAAASLGSVFEREHGLRSIDRAATGARAADATFVVGVKCRLVVDRDLFAGYDVSQREEEDVVGDDLHECVRNA